MNSQTRKNIIEASPVIPTITGGSGGERPRSRKAAKWLAAGAVAVTGAVFLKSSVDPSEATTRAAATFHVTEGNTSAAESILAAEGNPNGDPRPTESQLAAGEAEDGQITDGVHAGETVNLDLPIGNLPRHDENTNEVTVVYKK
jgi:hypothetical protein